MTSRIPNTLFAILLLTAIITARAVGGFVDYDDKAAWLEAAGTPTTIDFVLPPGGIITDQYASLGVSFPQGNDLAYFSASLFSDGWGAQGSPHTFGDMIVQWDQPLMAIACDFAGGLRLELFKGETLVYTSGIFGGPGIGHFGGVVSTVPFDRVRIWDPGDNGMALDNIHFVAIPAPGVMAALTLLGVTTGRRRRRTR